jgi:YaaC-like Protein
MAQVPQPRSGTRVVVRQRPVQFSFWPMQRSTRRFGLQSSLFVRDPWTVIRDAVQNGCPAVARAEALSCLEQARDFYASALSSEIAAARPLQLYYCFLNLAKALALTSGAATTFDRAQHGLSEQLPPGGRELFDAYLQVAPPAPTAKPQIFAEFYRAITASVMPMSLSHLDLTALLPQILPGHRLWTAAANRTERFIALDEVRLYEDKSAKALWLSIVLYRDDLSRLGLSHSGLLQGCRLDNRFRKVKSSEMIGGRPLIMYEQLIPTPYAARPSDVVPALVTSLKRDLWTVVGSSPPYRRYYVYDAPPAEQQAVLPQLLSVYALMYYLGSITRYRPQHFDTILNGRFGSQIEEFLAGQPTQYIYLMASEFVKRDVTQPAIV